MKVMLIFLLRAFKYNDNILLFDRKRFFSCATLRTTSKESA